MSEWVVDEWMMAMIFGENDVNGRKNGNARRGNDD